MNEVQRSIAAQMRRTFKKEIRLVKRHQAGMHKQPVATCDLCLEVYTNLQKRIREFKAKAVAAGA
jgi:hypothetical protein